MSSPKFQNLPMELVEHCAKSLEISDLKSFRLTCRRINEQIKFVVRERFFETWKTSLMGADLMKLEEISKDENIRKYVKHIHIEDDYMRIKAGFTAPHSGRRSYIWPRDHEFFVKSDEIGVMDLKLMLHQKRFTPETIRIRETYTLPNPGPAAILLQDILYGADPAILSLRVCEELRSVTGATARLSPKHQGQGVGLSMLHTAEFCFVDVKPSWWSDQIFYDAPALENLALNFMRPWHAHSELLIKPPIFKLRKLNLFQLSFPAHLVLQLLINSKDSLADLTFNMMHLSAGSTWQALLSSIGQDFPLLTSFKLRYISHQTAGNVRFEQLSKETVEEQYRSNLEIGGSSEADKTIKWVHYNGIGGDEILKIVAGCAVPSLED